MEMEDYNFINIGNFILTSITALISTIALFMGIKAISVAKKIGYVSIILPFAFNEIISLCNKERDKLKKIESNHDKISLLYESIHNLEKSKLILSIFKLDQYIDNIHNELDENVKKFRDRKMNQHELKQKLQEIYMELFNILNTSEKTLREVAYSPFNNKIFKD